MHFSIFRKKALIEHFEKGNVLKLSSYRPNNKKSSNLWWEGVQQTLNLRVFWKSAPGLTVTNFLLVSTSMTTNDLEHPR